MTRILFVIFLVMGLVFIGLAIHTINKTITSQSWPTTEGVVIISDMETEWELRSRSSKTDSRSVIRYSPEVVYRYLVDGKTYSANTISFIQKSSRHLAHVQKVLNEYPIGRTVVVHYNSLDPQNAVLQTHISIGNYVAIATGILFLVIGILGGLGKIPIRISNTKEINT